MQINNFLGAGLEGKFEVFAYRNADTILSGKHKSVLQEIVSLLSNLTMTRAMIRMPGGNKGPIVKHIDDTIGNAWQREARISADLNVTIKTKSPSQSEEYSRQGYLDGHQIDYLLNRVALDVEWNSKDQTFDRDLYAFSAFYDAGAIDMGILLTRGSAIDDGSFLRSLGNVLNKDGSEGSEPVYKKFGASTTNMSKLLYRLEAGRNGGCPVLVIGMQPRAFS